MVSSEANIDGVNDFVNPNKSSDVDNTSGGANLPFPFQQYLKWSEGINDGPHYNTSPPTEMESVINTTDINSVALNAEANKPGATLDALLYGQNTQPELKAWCTWYAKTSLREQEQNLSLTNHCPNTSAFVSYAGIKQCGLNQPQTKPLQSTANASLLPKYTSKASDEENISTSKRTHFRHIEKNVNDINDIKSDLDSVEFERRKSGLMRYEELLDYPSSDTEMADDEVAQITKRIKPRRPCKHDHIRVSVKRSDEITWQTEEEDFQLAAAIPTTTTSTVASTNLIGRETCNKFVAAPAKTTTHLTWLQPLNTANLDNNAERVKNAFICDEVDQGHGSTQQQQQYIKTKFPSSVVKKANNEKSLDNCEYSKPISGVESKLDADENLRNLRSVQHEEQPNKVLQQVYNSLQENSKKLNWQRINFTKKSAQPLQITSNEGCLVHSRDNQNRFNLLKLAQHSHSLTPTTPSSMAASCNRHQQFFKMNLADNRHSTSQNFHQQQQNLRNNYNNNNVYEQRNSSANLKFPGYHNTIWSPPSNPPTKMESLINTTTNNAMGITLFEAFSTTADITGATWEAPVYGQSIQPDLDSWCASNIANLNINPARVQDNLLRPTQTANITRRAGEGHHQLTQNCSMQHTNWGMCDGKTLPSKRLSGNELKLDADEIIRNLEGNNSFQDSKIFNWQRKNVAKNVSQPLEITIPEVYLIDPRENENMFNLLKLAK